MGPLTQTIEELEYELRDNLGCVAVTTNRVVGTARTVASGELLLVGTDRDRPRSAGQGHRDAPAPGRRTTRPRTRMPGGRTVHRLAERAEHPALPGTRLPRVGARRAGRRDRPGLPAQAAPLGWKEVRGIMTMETRSGSSRTRDQRNSQIDRSTSSGSDATTSCIFQSRAETACRAASIFACP